MGASLQDIASWMNTVAAFVGPRSASALDRDSLAAAGVPDGIADVAVLFGGSIVAGGDVFAHAMQAGVARCYVICGGEGHTTETLRQKMRGLYPNVVFDAHASEAILFDAYLRSRYSLAADLLETESTNFGNNVINLLGLLDKYGIARSSMIAIQDASMQRRMDAGIRLHAPQTRVVNYAAYHVEVQVTENGGGGLAYDHVPAGMWSPEHYRRLLMGEVPRLRDDERGYGPCGAGYIAHVEMPKQVLDAFEGLRSAFPESVRVANPAFASPA